MEKDIGDGMPKSIQTTYNLYLYKSAMAFRVISAHTSKHTLSSFRISNEDIL